MDCHIIQTLRGQLKDSIKLLKTTFIAFIQMIRIIFYLRQSIDIIIKKYNNHILRTTKYTPNQIFCSKDEELYNKILENIKSLFKSIWSENQNFQVKEKCLLKCKFSGNKAFKEKNDGVLVYNRTFFYYIY